MGQGAAAPGFNELEIARGVVSALELLCAKYRKGVPCKRLPRVIRAICGHREVPLWTREILIT